MVGMLCSSQKVPKNLLKKPLKSNIYQTACFIRVRDLTATKLLDFTAFFGIFICVYLCLNSSNCNQIQLIRNHSKCVCLNGHVGSNPTFSASVYAGLQVCKPAFTLSEPGFVLPKSALICPKLFHYPYHRLFPSLFLLQESCQSNQGGNKY